MIARGLSALVLFLIGVVVISIGQGPLFLFVYVSALMSGYELMVMIFKKSFHWSMIPTGLICSGLMFISCQPMMYGFWVSMIPKILVLALVLGSIVEVFLGRVFFTGISVWSVLRVGLLVLLTFPFLYWLREGNQGLIMMWFCCVLIWGCDIFALLVGRKFGKHPLSHISPKKTWEGSLAAVVAALVFGGIFIWFFHLPVLRFALYALLISVVSQLGDLHESLTKRHFHVKDSSQLIPGHGGFYDRADSYLFVMPLFFYLFN